MSHTYDTILLADIDLHPSWCRLLVCYIIHVSVAVLSIGLESLHLDTYLAGTTAIPQQLQSLLIAQLYESLSLSVLKMNLVRCERKDRSTCIRMLF